MAEELSNRTRAANLDRMARDTFDVVIVGGGITGAGLALDAAARGLSVALIERRDFAAGTSSRTTKLIHGGLRYLEQFEFGLVREALDERATLREIAPHLSLPLPFLVPLYSRGTPSPLGSSKLKLRIGLWLYDFLAGRRNIAPHRWLRPKQVLEFAPRIKTTDLRGAFLYYDCLTNDSRLVIEVIKAAASRGALVANYAPVHGLVKQAGRVSGVEVRDAISDRKLEIRARVVVSATGVWSDKISTMDRKHLHRTVRPSRGVHAVLPLEKLATRAAVLIPSLGEQRFLFVLPWCGRAVLGTTDKDHSGELDEPQAEPAEIERLIASASKAFPAAHLTPSDVIATFAGLRPLAGQDSNATKDISRKDQILESESGLISVIGGKLTTYRGIAERVIDLVERRLAIQGGTRRQRDQGVTRHIELAGGVIRDPDREVEAARAARDSGLSPAVAKHIVDTYGRNYRSVLEISHESDQLKQPLVPELPNIAAEVVYAARYEMALTIEDVLERRTRVALLAYDRGRSSALLVARLMSAECGWTDAETESAAAKFTG